MVGTRVKIADALSDALIVVVMLLIAVVMLLMLFVLLIFPIFVVMVSVAIIVPARIRIAAVIGSASAVIRPINVVGAVTVIWPIVVVFLRCPAPCHVIAGKRRKRSNASCHQHRHGTDQENLPHGKISHIIRTSDGSNFRRFRRKVGARLAQSLSQLPI